MLSVFSALNCKQEQKHCNWNNKF